MVQNYEPLQRKSHTEFGHKNASTGITAIRTNKLVGEFVSGMSKDGGSAEDAFVRMEAICAAVMAHMIRAQPKSFASDEETLDMIARSTSLMCENIGRLLTNILVKEGVLAAHAVVKFMEEARNAQRGN